MMQPTSSKVDLMTEGMEEKSVCREASHFTGCWQKNDYDVADDCKIFV